MMCAVGDHTESSRIVDSKELGAIELRVGLERDVEDIARLACVAGGDTMSFVLKGFHPAVGVFQTYRNMIAEPEGIFSFTNCFVALASGRIVGMANACPANLIRSEAPAESLTACEQLLRPRSELGDWSSFFLNNISVETGYRRFGVGSILLDAVIAAAKRRGFPSLTLHVWADNHVAIAFYRRFGFRQRGRAAIPWHVDLPHEGGSLLLKLPLRVSRARAGITKPEKAK